MVDCEMRDELRNFQFIFIGMEEGKKRKYHQTDGGISTWFFIY